MLGDEALWASDVVANCDMNRLRQLTGPNSYERELGFDPLDVLPAGGAWLDLCCGSGRALHQARRRVPDATVVGVDLVDAFGAGPAELVCAPVERFEPGRRFDLITCVHGLHYVGDKLGLLADDRAGPNYTGQPAVTSHYRPTAPGRRPRPPG